MPITSPCEKSGCLLPALSGESLCSDHMIESKINKAIERDALFDLLLVLIGILGALAAVLPILRFTHVL